jgi:hypothetical protein
MLLLYPTAVVGVEELTPAGRIAEHDEISLSLGRRAVERRIESEQLSDLAAEQPAHAMSATAQGITLGTNVVEDPVGKGHVECPCHVM